MRKTMNNKTGKSLLAILLLSATIVVTPTAKAQDMCGGNLGPIVNSQAKDYQPVVVYGNTKDYLYFTSSKDELNDKRDVKKALESKMYVCERDASARKRGTTTPINEGWSEPRRVVTGDRLFDPFTQGAMSVHNSTNSVVFAAERSLGTTEDASSYNLDLWQSSISAPDKFGDVSSLEPKPLFNVNQSNTWESQPAFHPRGTILFFVSNRRKDAAAGTGDMNIWYTVRDDDGNWRNPTLLRDITTSGDEMSPFVSPDGRYLYFASDWNYAMAKMGTRKRDLWRVQLRNTESSEGLDSVYVVGAPVDLDEAIKSDAIIAGRELCSLKFNSDGNDESPYLTQDGKYVFFTSDRDGGGGSRDIYAYGLPQAKICVRAEVEERSYDQYGLLVKRELSERAVTLQELATGKTESFYSTRDLVCLEPNSSYKVSYTGKATSCATTVETAVSEYIINTGAVDSTVSVRFTVKIGCPKPPDALDLSDASAGVPYYITGYWKPNTSENFAQFRQQWNSENSALKWANPDEPDVEKKNMKFIDPYDLQVGDTFKSGGSKELAVNNSEDFGVYASSTSTVDKFMAETVYPRIEQAIATLGDTCCTSRALKITVHGYTDACRLSPGSYAGESITVGTGVPAAFGVDVHTVPGAKRITLPANHYMQKSKIENEDGTSYQLADGGQNGNVALSMLRAYYMAETMAEGMKKRSQKFASMYSNGLITFETMGYGVFNPVNFNQPRKGASADETCPPVNMLTLGEDGVNGPRKTERCNVPEYRRIMVYFSYVDSLQVAAGHQLDKCGKPAPDYLKRLEGVQKQFDARIAEQRRVQDSIDGSPTIVQQQVAKADTAASIVPGTKNSYIVEYMNCRSEEDATVARQLLTALAIPYDEQQVKEAEATSWKFLSKEFPDRTQALASHESVNKQFASLRAMLSSTKVKRVN